MGYVAILLTVLFLLIVFFTGIKLGISIANRGWSRLIDSAKFCCECRGRLNQALEDQDGDE